MTQATIPPPTKVVVENVKYVVPPNLGLKKNSYHNNKHSAIVCSVIWVIISMLTLFYTVMAVRQMIYVTDHLSDDYKEDVAREKKYMEEHPETRIQVTFAMILCNNMKAEIPAMLAMTMYALLALINVVSPVLHIYGVITRNPNWTVPFVFTTGITFVIFATSFLVLLYTGDATDVYGFRAAAVLICIVMLLLMFHPIYQNGFLIEEVNILKNARNSYVKVPRVKSKGGLIHTVSAKTQTATPKKSKAATPKKSNITTPKRIQIIP